MGTATSQTLGRNPGGFNLASTIVKDSANQLRQYNKKVVKMSNAALKTLTPLVTGKAGLLVTRMPEYMKSHPNKQIQDLCTFMEIILNGWVTSVSGITDKTSNVGTGDTGSQGTSVDYFTNVDGQTRNISVKLPFELADAPISTFLELYQAGIGGDDSQVAHYNGRDDLEYSNANHSFEFLYFTYDPGMRKVIKAYKFENGLLKTGKDSIGEWDKASVAHVEITLEFAVSARTGNSTIYNACQKVLDAWRKSSNVKLTSDSLDYASDLASVSTSN